MRRHLKSSLSLSFALLLSGACATTSPLASRIDRATSAPALQHAIWGIDVQDDSGRVLYHRNAHTLLIPASNRKLFATSTALDCWGVDHQFPTELWLDGDNVVIRGSGDPSLAGGFAPFIDALRARAIDSVNDVIADVSAFDRETIPGGWEVEDVGTDYGAPVDALAYYENVVDVTVLHCEQPQVLTDPPFVSATANVSCGSGEPAVRSDATNALTIEGPVSSSEFEALPSIADPALYAAQAFRDALLRAGIAVRGTVRVNTTPQPWPERLAIIESPPLSALLATTLKISQNLYAEMLFKSTAGTYAGAEDLERAFLTSIGIDGSEFHFADGCGLSPKDLVTPSAIVTLLRWMNQPWHRGLFWAVLATPGEEGTLHRRLLPLAARLRGKTGSIGGANALSGIVAGTHGGYRYFSIILNHHTAGSRAAIHAIDEIAEAIADF